MVEIHPVEHMRPLPVVEKVERDERRKQQQPDLQKGRKTAPTNNDDSPSHIDEYA